ncbi:MAG: DNA polymerase III subunit gamma/tau [Bacteroidaceae bacterium]|nr:DNA polymerase III subunit gamma/tau [Bacteroidaceae bacterium]
MEQYIVSARKYRPVTFDMVVGQRALTTTLLNAIRTGKLAHAYLFCGPRGVGKTTCARIFAKTINCMNLGADGQPCCECESCRAFEEGRSMNIHELDAASNNSVDDIRELIDQVRIPPQVGRYKVFIIDEVHMLSQQAFNAFLKTLEEPPKYVIFILATTEKHKILPTILSRCQVYDFARITIQNTIDHLKYVAQKEGYNVEEEALSLIARKADGGMRDALSIFDQMVSFTQGNITYQSTLENLNILDSEYYFRLVDHLLNKEVEASLLLFNEVVEKGFDGGNFIAGLASHLRNLLVSRDAKTLPLLEVGETQQQRYHEQALRCRPQFLYRTIRLCNDCDLGYRQSRNKRLQVEICLIQAAQSADDDGDGAGRRPAKILKPLFKQLTAPRAETVATAQRTGADSPAAGSAAAAPRTPSIPEKKIPSVSQPAAKPKNTIAISLNSISIRNIRPASSQPQTAPTTQQPSPAQTSSSAKAGHLDTDNLILFWQQYANSLPQSEVATAQRMRGTTPELISPEEFVVTVNNPLIEKQLLKMQKSIEDYFSRQLNGSRVSMKVRVIEVEIAVKSYNKAEQFQQLLRENPNFAKLHEEFALELN